MSFKHAILLLAAAALGAAPDPRQSAPVDKILRSLPNPAGVCVHLGCGDGTTSAKLAQGGMLLVHALESDERKVAEARKMLQSRGLYGQVSVEPWSSASLPYPDNLINVIVAEKTGTVPQAELMRVLAPGGVVWMLQGGSWKMTRKPCPAEFDAWTHWRHGAGGNMVSGDLAVAVPTGIRWIAGPPQDAGGRKWYNDHVLVSSNGRNLYVFDTLILARDAYNGSLLWKRTFKSHAFRERGLKVKSKRNGKWVTGSRTTKVRPVAVGDEFFAVVNQKLIALDALTGKTSAEFGPVADARDILVENGLLVLADGGAVRAYDAGKRKLAWRTELDVRRMVAGDGKLFCLSGDRMVALDLASGKERWYAREDGTALVQTCTYRDGILVLEKSTWRDEPEGCGILVHAAEDGGLLWRKDYKPDMTHYREARAFLAGELLWLQVEKNRLIGHDPRTGKVVKQWRSRGKHCATPVATERYFIAPECDFTDLRTGEQTRARMFKSACRLPFIPANGLLNTFPVQCECYPMLRGYMGLAPGKLPSIAAAGRRKEGPAARRASTDKPLLRPAEATAEWPTYRRDVFRSGSTPNGLGTGPLRRVWERPVASAPQGHSAAEWEDNPFVRGLLTPPVAAGGSVFVAVPDQHRLVALDAKTGRPRWTYTAGGRIDGPPTIHEGLCLFGSHDGWVTCLSASDGGIAWRFRAAPRETRIMAYGQMESPWPVPASILVDGGVAYFAAGRHPVADGGIHVFALKVLSGEVVWEKTIDELNLKGWYGAKLPNKNKVGLDFEPIDIFVKDGRHVSMSRWKFNPANGDFELAVGDTEYEAAGGKRLPRGLWGYGIRQTKKVLPKPPAVYDGSRLRSGSSGDAAVIMAGGTEAKVTAGGELKVGERTFKLDAPPVHDGMIAAYGKLYLSTRKGTVVCIE